MNKIYSFTNSTTLLKQNMQSKIYITLIIFSIVISFLVSIISLYFYCRTKIVYEQNRRHTAAKLGKKRDLEKEQVFKNSKSVSNNNKSIFTPILSKIDSLPRSNQGFLQLSVIETPRISLGRSKQKIGHRKKHSKVSLDFCDRTLLDRNLQFANQ